MSCTQNRQKNEKQRKLPEFSLASSLHFSVIDIVGPLPKTEIGDQYVVVITDIYYKPADATPKTKTVATRIANIVREYQVANFKIQCTVLRDVGPQFTSRFCAALCKEQGVKRLTTTKYLPRANGQVKGFNAIML